MTGRRAVVATVDRKWPDVAERDRLPDTVAGIPVDVRQASPRKKQELLDPEQSARELRLSPDLASVPHFADEISPTGTPPGVGASAHARFAALAAGKPRLTYTPPTGASLAPVTGSATVHLAASPDAGWSL